MKEQISEELLSEISKYVLAHDFKYELRDRGFVKDKNAKSGDIMWAYELMKAGKEVYKIVGDNPKNRLTIKMKKAGRIAQSTTDENYYLMRDDFEATWYIEEKSNIEKARELASKEAVDHENNFMHPQTVELNNLRKSIEFYELAYKELEDK